MGDAARFGRVAGACLLTLALAACVVTPPATTPAATAAGVATASSPAIAPGAAIASGAATWVEAAVSLPESVTGMVAGQQANIQCSPCHAAQADLLLSVTRTAQGWIAVGAQEPPSIAVAWTSADGRDWAPVGGLHTDPGSIATAVAALGARTVIVGGDAAGATAWVSTDDATWRAAPPDPGLAGPNGTARMTAITTWQGGFVAAGYASGAAQSAPVAAVWMSQDGLSWRRVSSGPAFYGGRILGLAASADTLVAVGSTANASGTSGTSETSGTSGTSGTPGLAWASHDAIHWSRSTAPALRGGSMRAVVAAAGGFIAVGVGAADDGAAAWTSADGLAWQAVPDQSAFDNSGRPIRMASVAAMGDRIVAVGWLSDPANGSGTAWRTRDGTHWTRDPDQVALLGGELAGVAPGPNGFVGVGAVGYPDNDQAAAWLSGP